MTGSQSPITAPGLAFQELLRQSKPPKLKELIGESIVETLEGLDRELLLGDKLGELALRLIDPLEALRDPEQRDRIINLLPLPKARELAARLSVEVEKSLYPDLCLAAADYSALETLLSFFGVVREVRAPAEIRSDITSLAAGYSLFEHQRHAASKVKIVLSKPPNKVVLHMPTGAGKTRTAMHIIISHLKSNEPTVICWLAQNAELLDQAADEFERAWQMLGDRPLDLIRFWGKRRPDISEICDGVIIAGLGKMYAFDNRKPAEMLKLADRVSLTVIDEAHQAIAPTYASILSALHTKRPKNQLLGLTATPGRTWSDITADEQLSAFFDNQKVTLEVEGYDDPVSFLIEEGYLAKPIFKTLNSEAGIELSDRDVKELSEAVDVPDALLERLGDNAKRNLKITSAVEDLATRHNRIIVFAASVASARLLTAILVVRGHDAYVVTGETGASERERIVKRFKSNRIRPIIVCNYGVLTTGFDAPGTSAALIARPTRSLVLYSQMVGRATRGPKAGGNAEAEIVTVADPHLPGFGSIADAFRNWEDVWNEPE